MFLTYKEISEVLSNLDEEYEGLRKTGNAHQQRVGSMSLFLLRRVRRKVNEKIQKKYSK